MRMIIAVQAATRPTLIRLPLAAGSAVTAAREGAVVVAMTISLSGQIRLAGPQHPQLYQRNAGENDEQDHRQGAGVAELALDKALLVDVVLDDAAGIAWPTSGGHRYGVEHLERAGNRDHQHQRQDRPQQRH